MNTPTIHVTCTACGSPMVITTDAAIRTDGPRYLVCSTWPECRETQPLPAYILMREAGAAELPGFES